MTIHERLQVFFSRLEQAKPFNSHKEALAGVYAILTAVEDEFSGIPRHEEDNPPRSDGRMYPPIPSLAVESGIAGVTRYRHTQHDTFIGDNGAITIRIRATKEIKLERPGSDGNRIVL